MPKIETYDWEEKDGCFGVKQKIRMSQKCGNVYRPRKADPNKQMVLPQNVVATPGFMLSDGAAALP